MSTWRFKKLVNAKTQKAGLKYLLEQKETQTKTLDLKYSDLVIEEHFVSGGCNKNMSRLICKARTKTLDIKTQQRWKYADLSCIGCKIRKEEKEEILFCELLNNENRVAEIPAKYDMFYSNDVADMIKLEKLSNLD